MADNVQVTAGSGTTIATDDVGGVHYQVVKVAHGAADAATLVSSTSPIPSTLTNLEKAEDAGHSTGDKGVMLLAVRKDTAAALAGTDADYIPLIVDASGRLHVVQSGLTLTDDAAFAAGTSKVSPMGAVYQSTVDEVDANDIGAPRMTIRRAQIIAPDYRAIYGDNSSVVNIGDAEVSTTSSISGFGAPATSHFNGVTISTTTHYIRVPWGTWRSGAVALSNVGLGVNLTVNIYAQAFTNVSGGTHKLDGATVASGGSIIWAPGAGGSAVAATYVTLEALQNHFAYVLIEYTAASGPAAGSIRFGVTRGA